MKYSATVTRLGTPLQYIPVQHRCGHFELRYTRWSPGDPLAPEDEVAKKRGHLMAGNQCVHCAPNERPCPNPDDAVFASLGAAQIAAAEANKNDARQRP